MASTPADSAGEAIEGSPAEATTPVTSKDQRRRARRMRKILVNVLAVLTCLATLLTVIAWWTHRTVMDTDQWMEIVGPLADDPTVTDAVAIRITDQLFEAVDAQNLAQEALPERAQFLAVPLTNAVKGYVGDGVAALLRTDQFKTIWDRANRIAHENAIKLLRGEPVAGFTADDGTVTLNLLPLMSRAMTFLDEKAPRLFGDRPIPEITQETPPDQARAELSEALGRQLPADFGTYVVLQSDQLAAAQQALNLFDRLVYVLLFLTIALLVATLVLSRDRRRTLLVLGLGIALAMVVANAIVSAVQEQVVGLITGEAARNAVATALRELISSLEGSTTVLAWIGLAVVVAAFLTGDGRTATGVRRVVAGGARTARDRGVAMVGRDSGPTAPVPVIAEHHGAFRAAGVAVTMLWLIVTDITWVKLGLILLAFVIYQFAITVLGRRLPGAPTDGGDGTAADAGDLAAAGPS